MTQLVYSREQLMADHDYAQYQHEAGYRLHGGLDEQGTYISPRTLHRWPAVQAWQAQLAAQNKPLLNADQALLQRDNYPNAEQQTLLLKHGFGEVLWDSLTVTGVIEARGQVLVELPCPNFQAVIVEDISQTATGHLAQGLLVAHGMDEGGDPQAPEVGAHDAMWFAVRDALFGEDAYPIPEVPESIGKPEEGRRFPGIPEGMEGMILLLMNVLMIEVRAESFFSFCCTVMRDPRNFQDRSEAAEHAAKLVERIRTDEAIHVAYLQTVISELRGFTFKLDDDSTVSGASLIDPVWEQLVEWHGKTTFDFGREQTRAALDTLVGESQPALLAQFDALDTALPVA